MTTDYYFMMSNGYVIPAKAGNQYYIFEIITIKLNLSKPDKQKN